jgi:hypothetical protein
MKYRSRRQATEYLRENGIPIGGSRLAQLAMTGEGPRFRYSGRYCVYVEKDLDAWAESRMSRPVTSSTAKARQADEKPRRSPGRSRSNKSTQRDAHI